MNNLPWWEQALVLMGFIFLLGGIFWLSSDGPEITGMFTKEVKVQMIDKTISEPTTLQMDSGEHLFSVKIWAAIVGEGEATVWLVNERDERLLVFTNAQKKGLGGITSFVSSEMENPEQQNLWDGYCADTCIIPGSFDAKTYHLLIEVDPNTQLKVQRVQVES